MGLLDNKICIVTGASKGIGKAITLRLLQEGAFVHAIARNADGLNELSATVNSDVVTKDKIKTHQVDISEFKELKQIYFDIHKQEKKIDVLVNNAGVVAYGPLEFVSDKVLEDMLKINVAGTFFSSQTAARLMKKSKSGSIINISSAVAVHGVEGQVAYAMTKGAVNAFTVSAAKELAASGIRVNAVAPGMVKTERLDAIMKEKFSSRLSDIRFGRMSEPHEIADIVVFLASEMSSYVTGQVITADGSFKF